MDGAVLLSSLLVVGVASQTGFRWESMRCVKNILTSIEKHVTLLREEDNNNSYNETKKPATAMLLLVSKWAYRLPARTRRY